MGVDQWLALPKNTCSPFIFYGIVFMIKHLLICTILSVSIPFSFTQSAVAQEKWQPHIDVEGKIGNKRDLGEVDLFVPLWQNDHQLLFGNFRGKIDNDDGQEGNYGIGLRHMLPSGWNIGAYGYFDRRRTPMNNMFSQITFGAEALSMDWDLRANAYIPVGPDARNVDSMNAADITGTTVTFRGGQERSLSGLDAELGWRIPVFGVDEGKQLRIYGGGYRFHDSDVDTIAGPRGRIDLTIDEVPFLWEGSRFTIGGEIQHDDPRGTQSFATARLRIPLQVFSKSENRKTKLTPIERRMADPIMRDVDVVTMAGAFGPAEVVTQTASGATLSIVDVGTTAGANLAAAVASAGANSTVVVQGAFTGVDNVVNLQTGQTLMGQGSLNVKSPSGRTATLQTGSVSLIGSGTLNASIMSVINMANNSSLIGITANNINPGGNGAATIHIDGVSNVTIRGNTIGATATGSGSTPIFIEGGASNITITDNTLSAIGAGTQLAAGGAMINVGSNIIFSNNAISATNTTSRRSLFLNNATNLSGSGNTRNGETCATAGTNSGSISFTDNSTCP